MTERIKKLRSALGLTQQEFADRTGLKQNTVATYEMGRSNPSDPTINNICKEFNVNETWLRSGIGEMFNPAPCDALDTLAEEYGLTHGDYILIEKFINLKPQSRRAIVDYVMEVSAAFSISDAPAASFDPAAPGTSPHLTLVASRDGGLSTADADAINRLGLEMQEDDTDL